MAKVGAQRAAELTGKSKSTIQRAMNQGKLSFEIDNNKRRIIDVSELERVFGLAPDAGKEAPNNAAAELEKAEAMIEMERLKMQVKMLEMKVETAEEQVEDLKAQRDQWQKQAQQVLITSQYSQKQAEEFKAELKAREERARKRREEMMAKKMQKIKAENENTPTPKEEEKTSAFDFQGMWQKIKGGSSKPGEKAA
jgi:uncharacterized protein (DUF3084 family)